MKKKIIIIVCILLVFIITGIICYKTDSIRFKITYEYINYMEYSNGKKIKVSIPFNNKIKYLNEEELIDFLNNGTGIIYFGYNTCPWCRNIVPILINASNDSNIDTIYYIDTHNLDIKSIKNELYEILDSYLSENDKGNKVLAVPNVFSVKEGTILSNHLGTIDSYNNPYSGMTKEEKEELYNIYKDMIGEIVNE